MLSKDVAREIRLGRVRSLECECELGLRAVPPV
jgi:hypothetical protein